MYILNGHKKKDIEFLSLEIIFVRAFSEDPGEMSCLPHFIWVFTVCQVPVYGYSGYKILHCINDIFYGTHSKTLYMINSYNVSLKKQVPVYLIKSL